MSGLWRFRYSDTAQKEKAPADGRRPNSSKGENNCEAKLSAIFYIEK
jgi:hypothetical protein